MQMQAILSVEVSLLVSLLSVEVNMVLSLCQLNCQQTELRIRGHVYYSTEGTLSTNYRYTGSCLKLNSLTNE